MPLRVLNPSASGLRDLSLFDSALSDLALSDVIILPLCESVL